MAMPRLRRRDAVDDLAVDRQRARRDVLEPGDQPQQGGLAATRRADEHHEFAGPDIEVDALDHLDGAERFSDIGEANSAMRSPAPTALFSRFP